MTHAEYIELFHRAQVNLVAFKPVFHCDEELKAMVELAIAKEREEFAVHAVDIARRAVAEEREACAKTSFIYDLTPWKYDLGHLRIAQIVSIEIGKAIRARGQA